ncbi:uncharacterized protein fl(2)d [Plodia interpunctella]|uniref:uncharacterized protein fl(2)d n=1 Tax=Plodia interpunctella TaxID=58824 RepID=UPI002367B214|nr:uncharacterized protein LOC128675354 [Plodia interpunctella]
MSEEAERHGEAACDNYAGSGGGTKETRVLLTPHQLDAASADSLRSAWRTQDLYIDHLETLNKQLEGSLEKAKEIEDRIKQQYAESQHREKVLVRRLAAKEQEIQDYVSQITELKSSHASLNGRPTLLDPAVNVLILRLKQELTSTKARLEETQNELSAWKFTPDSNTGKKLMAKCRLLHQENEDLGRMTSSGRIAKLEGDLALQKNLSEEVKKSQSELDDFLQELDEDVEGMQSTVLFLQQELRASHASLNGARPSPDKRRYSGSDRSDTPRGKRRRASVLSLDYNEDEDPLTVIKISNGNPKNKIFLLTAGQHAREWISITSALYIVDEIINRFDNQPHFVKDLDWYILPLLNPDGYEYSLTRDRLWRKNRRKFGICYGVDINRNFDIDWKVPGVTESNVCSEAYSGPKAFSEAESVTLSDFVKRLSQIPAAFVDLHSYGQQILYPWCARTEQTPSSDLHKSTAAGIAEAIYKENQKVYKYGPAYHLMYPASGSALDWAYKLGVNHSYAIETRDKGTNGFLLPPSLIVSTGRELFQGVKYLASVLQPKYKKNRNSWL